MKKELLSPAGSKEAFYSAVHAGADAVYLGGKSFGARAYAANFSDEELVEIIKYAHLYNVKVYITVNTLIKDSEFEEAIKFISFLHKNDVDAIIIQDLGLASIVHKMFPNLELHASTQLHNLDHFTTLFLKNIGIKRLVLARETTLNEINNINTDLELEIFIHGALCMSYSGECLLSSMAMNRSGNRGSCSQLCRMPYELFIEGEKFPKTGNYLLSPKDLSTVSIFDEIINSSAHALKIEGRMKSPEYVYTVTKLYRKLLDAHYNNENVSIDKELNDLNQLFNRGYSTGHFKSSEDLMGIKRGNHKGVEIGKTIDVNEKFITIKLDKNLHVGDGIKFDKADKGLNAFNIYKSREIIKDGLPGDIITIPNKIGLTENDIVLKTVDVLLNEELKVYEEKKIDVDIKVVAKLNQELEVTISDGVNEFKEKGAVVEKSTNKEVTDTDIKEKITKLGSTAFKVNNLEINKDDNIFIRLSEINNLRRVLTDKLTEKRMENKTKFIENKVDDIFNKEDIDEELSVYVRNQKQLDIIKKYPVKRIYTNSYELYMNNKDVNIYYETNINDNYKFDNDKLLINSTSDIMKFSNNELVLNYSLNVFNSNTLNFLSKYGICTYSPELTLDDLKELDRKVINQGELLIYGKVKVMTMKHCLLFDKLICDTCKYKNSNRELVDSFNRAYKVTCNEGINYLYDHKDVLKIRDIKELRFIGIKRYRIDLYNENESQIVSILNEFYNNK